MFAIGTQLEFITFFWLVIYYNQTAGKETVNSSKTKQPTDHLTNLYVQKREQNKKHTNKSKKLEGQNIHLIILKYFQPLSMSL